MSIKFIELFSGIGGFRYGLERNGFKCVWANDNNKYANQIYKKNFGTKELQEGDIRSVDVDRIPDHDLLCAGFPCQAFSLAGKRQGFNDTRGTLFFEIARILEAKRPQTILLENVKGLLSHDNGKTFARILSVLDELRYWLEWQVLNSKNFRVPQNRERVFIVGHLRNKSFKQIFPLRENAKIFNEERTGERKKQVANTIKARDYSNWRGNFVIPKIAGSLTGGGHSGGLHSDMPVIGCTLRQRDRHGKDEVRGQQLELREDFVSNALTSVEKDSLVLDVPYAMGNGKPNRSTLCSGRTPEVGNKFESIRRLTPIECERLQGFPDNWTKDLSDTQRYKCLGNAVTTNVIQAIGEVIQ